MTNNVDYKKGVCQCRKCGSVFHQKDVKTIQVERYGLQREDKVSPCCESTYGYLDYPVTEEELIYKNSKFYVNHNKI